MKKWIPGIAGAIIVASVIYNISGGKDPDAFAEELKEARADTDRFMRFSEESPFKTASIEFDSLRYFPPDLKYRVTARFTPVEKREILKLPTSDGQVDEYLTYGHASFTLDGKQQKLLILENVNEDKLFVPFGDDTSAEETYGAGRYLDIEHNGGGTVIIDFNYAYNPYCNYVEDYSCPLPPAQNLLTIPVRAGEMTYLHSDKSVTPDT